MEIGDASSKIGRGTVFVVTHVDVPPPRKDECVAALKALVADSRKEANAVRFEVFQQGNRPNHFSVVEIWRNQRAYDGHITAAHTKKFRDQLTPMTGALYDERFIERCKELHYRLALPKSDCAISRRCRRWRNSLAESERVNGSSSGPSPRRRLA